MQRKRLAACAYKMQEVVCLEYCGTRTPTHPPILTWSCTRFRASEYTHLRRKLVTFRRANLNSKPGTGWHGPDHYRIARLRPARPGPARPGTGQDIGPVGRAFRRYGDFAIEHPSPQLTCRCIHPLTPRVRRWLS